MQLSWIELDRAALHHNIQQFRQRLNPSCALLVPVKANAYGHGLTQMAPAFIDAGVQWLGVHSLEEAQAVQAMRLECPILVLGHIARQELHHIVGTSMRPMITQVESIDVLAQYATQRQIRVPIHLKVETGTNRQGLQGQALITLAQRIQDHSYLQLEGCYTHFANIEDTTDHTYAMYQWETFKTVQRDLAQAKIHVPMMHAAASAATMLFPQTHQDMVRTGISAYGLWPSKETYVSLQHESQQPRTLHPILSWKTRVSQVKDVPADAFVGYGCTYRTTRPTRLAIRPVGYYDGVDRRLSNLGYVLIHGRRAPIRGRVCMNLTMVDVTDIPQTQLEDTVVLLGTQQQESISAETWASWCGTIHYEILARLPAHIPRMWDVKTSQMTKDT
ncbi:MAG: alanine racemase [Myxococcota bacterium]